MCTPCLAPPVHPCPFEHLGLRPTTPHCSLGKCDRRGKQSIRNLHDRNFVSLSRPQICPSPCSLCPLRGIQSTVELDGTPEILPPSFLSLAFLQVSRTTVFFVACSLPYCADLVFCPTPFTRLLCSLVHDKALLPESGDHGHAVIYFSDCHPNRSFRIGRVIDSESLFCTFFSSYVLHPGVGKADSTEAFHCLRKVGSKLSRID